MSRNTTIVACLVVLACGQGVAQSATLYVNGDCGDNAWTGISPVCAKPNGPKATIQAAINAAGSGNEVIVAPGTYPEKINFGGALVAVRSAEGAATTIIDAQGTGTVVSFGSAAGPDTLLEGFTITGGYAGHGGGMANYGSPTIRDCIFTANQANVGAAIRSFEGSPRIQSCTLFDNIAVAAGTVANGYGQAVYLDCLFRNNDGQVINFDHPGNSFSYVNCRFSDNLGDIGGAAIDGGNSLWLNCAFSRNQARGPATSTIDLFNDPAIINCTLSESPQNGISVGDGLLTLANSVIWGVGQEAIVGSGSPAVSFCDIEGGWPGTGNIDADPLFVQPGTDDLRLSFGSPCVGAGSNAALPPDAFDLDGDGNTVEPVPLDLAGVPRVQDGVVDMGAYEGQYAPGAPASSNGDVDEGEFAVLVPEGGPFDPIESPAVILTNISGGDDGSATVTQIDGLIHPGAGGYSDLASVLVLDTSLDGGEFLATVFVPFDSSALGGAAPRDVRATWYDGPAGNWALGVWGNANVSPGYTGPIGDRIYVEAPGPSGVTQDAGDYGVYWDPVAGQGFAWANVDHASDFGVGIAPCPADCVQTPDGQVNIVDMLILLNDWGLSAGISCDLDSDGSIGAADFAALLKTWGPCTAPVIQSPDTPAPAATLRLLGAGATGSADIDVSGAVDRADLDLLMSCWGAQEAGCAADLDGDGIVGSRDYLHLLAHWDPVEAP